MKSVGALLLKCYRQQFGDVAVKDVMLPAEPLEQAKTTAKQNLIGWFNSTQFRSGEQPHTASLVRQDGTIAATFMVRPDTKNGGHEAVELPERA